MHSSLMLDNAAIARRNLATAFLCGFCGAVAGAIVAVFFNNDVSWLISSLAGAGVTAFLGWRHYDRH